MTTRKYLLCRYFLGVLLHTTAWTQAGFEPENIFVTFEAEAYMTTLLRDRGLVRGGSRGSIDPPRILEYTLKELYIWPFDPPLCNS